MHFAVCIKQILDPEIPPADFRLDPAGQKAAAGSASQVISIFDENALEVALQARDAAGGGKITALSVGPPSAVDALRKALSMRADDAILLPEENYAALDPQATARMFWRRRFANWKPLTSCFAGARQAIGTAEWLPDFSRPN